MKVIVLFKTHLDIGFTDLSANVVKKYNEIYIPQAITVAEEIARAGRPEGFVWTVGSWLVAQYLEKADQAAAERLENAIRNGWVAWHGLPCTMHSEICPAELYDYALSISAKLDRRFGIKTTGAKNTDVPGHSAAVIPHLADAGITLLHIGVNPASAAVEVPAVFRWQFGDKAINVMYNGGDYGEFTPIPGTDTYVYFAHTGDNLGPQSVEAVCKVYDEIYSKFPQATVVAGTLNDVANEIEAVADGLPVVTGEMGDTWIHGMATDPQKLSQFKAIMRRCAALDEAEREAVFSRLVLVPEHTWGMDEKTFLNENKNYTRPLFAKARNNYNYKIMELSWAEQRKYVLDAAAALSDAAEAEALMKEYYCQAPDFAALTPVSGADVDFNGMQIAFSETGAITKLVCEAANIRLTGCDLFGYSYDEYSFDEVWDFQLKYLKPRFIEDFKATGYLNWSINDFGKYGLQYERNEHTASAPQGFRLYCDDASLYVQHIPDERIIREHGLPAQSVLKITPADGRILFDFSWYGKPANRAPEALWLSFNPASRLRGISKLGHVIDPSTVLPRGGRGLHATDGKVIFDGVTVELVDSALVSVGAKNVYRFVTDDPDMDSGVYLNLFNNQWGTNFPMWNEGDARFRFVLTANAQ